MLAGLAASDRDGDGLPEHDGMPDQTYDTWPMHGPSAPTAAPLSRGPGRARGDGRTAEPAVPPGAAELARLVRTRARVAFERRLWRGDHYAYDDGGGPSCDSVMADQLAGQWYADVTGLGDLVRPSDTAAALRTVHRLNVVRLRRRPERRGQRDAAGRDGRRELEQSAEVWVGTTYALAAFMIGRGLVDEGWETARGAAAVTYERGLWFRTPEAYDRRGDFRASLYLRPLAIWAIEEALGRTRPDDGAASGGPPA